MKEISTYLILIFLNIGNILDVSRGTNIFIFSASENVNSNKVYLIEARTMIFFIICEYTVAVFRHSKRGSQISLWMVVSHHLVAGN